MHLLAHNRYLKMYPISCFFVSGHLVHFCISNLFAYINIIFIFLLNNNRICSSTGGIRGMHVCA